MFLLFFFSFVEPWLGCGDSSSYQCRLERKGAIESHSVTNTQTNKHVPAWLLGDLCPPASAVPGKRSPILCRGPGEYGRGLFWQVNHWIWGVDEGPLYHQSPTWHQNLTAIHPLLTWSITGRARTEIKANFYLGTVHYHRPTSLSALTSV